MKTYKGKCGICEIIIGIKKTYNEHFVYELKTGLVVLSNNQFYKGYSLFICKKHATELHELSPSFRRKYLEEMVQVAKVIWKSFNPNKINYELLGNSEPHLHWHIIPRYKNDPHKNYPIWSHKIKNINKFELKGEKLTKIRNSLREGLEHIK